MKRIALFVLLVALSGALLTGCLTPVMQQSLDLEATPSAGYPPLEITLTATGQSGGSYTFQFEGQTYTQPSPVLVAWVDELPCAVSVTWEGTGGPFSASVTIGLVNQGPAIGRLLLNGIENLWTIHPRGRYTVTFPDAHDPEGGPVTLVNAIVFHAGQGEPNTIFCPPYTGANPPKPDLYRVRTGAGDLLNAFVFYSTWNAPLNASVNAHPLYRDARTYNIGDKVRVGNTAYSCKKDGTVGIKPGVTTGWKKAWTEIGPVIMATDLPYTPPSQSEDGYPGAGATCDPAWASGFIPGGMTIITVTFEDERGATTTESFEIPTMPYPGC